MKTHVKNYSAGILTLDEVSTLNYKRLELLQSDLNKDILKNGGGSNRTGVGRRQGKGGKKKEVVKEVKEVKKVEEVEEVEGKGGKYPATTFFIVRYRHLLVCSWWLVVAVGGWC